MNFPDGLQAFDYFLLFLFQQFVEPCDSRKKWRANINRHVSFRKNVYNFDVWAKLYVICVLKAYKIKHLHHYGSETFPRDGWK